MEIKRARKGERRRRRRCRKENKIVKDRNMMKEKGNVRKGPESERDN
jgi:hypothetical protein